MNIDQAKRWITRAKEHIKVAKSFGKIGHYQKMKYHLNKATILLNGAKKCLLIL